MVTGVHARSLAFVGFDQALRQIHRPGWPWLGNPGRTATGRRLTLQGGPPRDFVLRPLSIKVAPRTVVCQVQLEAADGPVGRGLLMGALTFLPASGDAKGTTVTVSGTAARALAGAGAGPAAYGVRDLANAYARALVEAVALALEAASLASEEPERRAERAAVSSD